MLIVECVNDAAVSEIKRSNGNFDSTRPNRESHGFGAGSMKNTVEAAGGFMKFDVSKDKFTVRIML